LHGDLIALALTSRSDSENFSKHPGILQYCMLGFWPIALNSVAHGFLKSTL
jgi:hypothetical protein